MDVLEKLLSCAQIPKLGGPVKAVADQHFAVLAQNQGGDFRGVAYELVRFRSGMGIPRPDDAVGTGRINGVAVMAEYGGVHGPTVAFEFCVHQSRGDVPYPHRAIPACAHQQPLIGANRQGGDNVAVANKVPLRFVGIQLHKLQAKIHVGNKHI